MRTFLLAVGARNRWSTLQCFWRSFSSKTSSALVQHPGLELRQETEYPDEVSRMVDMITSSARTEQLIASLSEIDLPRKGTLLVRHFATRDDLGNAFRVVHALKKLGEPVDREAYRYLMYACCKYEDIDLGLYVMEQMLYDNRPDFRSFKRLFDACASAVDLRLWVAHDVMMWFYPLKGFGQNSLKTTAYITELMKTIGMRASSRAGRGFVTLPNPRGEPFDPFASMFEDDDPNYPAELEAGDELARARRRLIAEEFQDRNRMAQIVARNRARAEGRHDESQHLAVLEATNWSRQGVLAVIERTETEESENLAKMMRAREEAALLENRPTPSVKKALMAAWKNRRKRD